MADDSNFDSWHEDNWKSHKKNNLRLSSMREFGKPQDLECDKINHLLDEIVCNHCSSKNEFGEVQLRRINSAIYAESVKSSCNDSTELSIALSNISIDDNHASSSETYRCGPRASSTNSSSFVSTLYKSKSASKLEVRCRFDDDDQMRTHHHSQIRRYALNGRTVIHVSTPHSSCALSNQDDYRQFSTAKNLTHIQWLQKKKSETIRRKRMTKALQMKKKVDEDRLAGERAEHGYKKRENFSMWMEKKKQENDRMRRLSEKEHEIEHRLDEIEAKTIPIKEFHLRRWCREKRKMAKGREAKRELLSRTRDIGIACCGIHGNNAENSFRTAKRLQQELENKKCEEEKRKRIEESSRAFQLWYERSKNRPRPATQGLLPHQRAIPSYVNPIPWMVDDVVSVTQCHSPDVREPNAILARHEFMQTMSSEQ